MKAYQSGKSSSSSTHLKQPGQQSPPARNSMTYTSESLSEEVCALMTRVLSAKSVIHIGYWNIQLLFDTSKPSQVIKEKEDYKLNILGLCKIYWTASGNFSSEDKMTKFSGGYHGIHCDSMAIILDKSASQALTQWTPISECLMMARFVTLCAKVPIIQC